MHPAFSLTDHRPWPLPSRPWIMSMGWRDLLFAHWRVPIETLRPFIPSNLEIDIFGGVAWIGIVPFIMHDVRARGLPPIPGTSKFPELNVRSYVNYENRPGVWFFSLDASSWLAVRGARSTFNLPYFDAKFVVSNDGDAIRYQSERTHKNSPLAKLDVSYQPTGSTFRSKFGSFEHWLTERYCLYSANSKGQIFRGEIHHRPWPLQPAKAEFKLCNMTQLINWEISGPPESLLFAKDLQVAAWAPIRCN